MKPWDIKRTRKAPDDAFMVPLWADFRPKDFYIATTYDEAESTTTVYLVPSEYFDKTAFMYEDSMPITKYIPDYLIEIIECVYEAVNINEVRVRKDLLDAGFRINPFFQTFIDKNMHARGFI